MDGLSFKDYLEIWNLSFIFPCIVFYILFQCFKNPKPFKILLLSGTFLFVVGMNLSLYFNGPGLSRIDYISVVLVLLGGLISLISGILFLREKHYAKKPNPSFKRDS